MKNAVAIAAAVLLFFVLSNQAENTYVNDADYASLGTEGLFCAIRGESMLSHSFAMKPHKGIPIAVRVEKVPARKTDAVTGATQTVPERTRKNAMKKEKAPKEKTQQKDTTKHEKSKGKYHVIVASLNNATDARVEAERLQEKGYADVKVLESVTRCRVSIGGYENQAEAYKKINEVRRIPGMETAWVYTQE